MFVGKIERVMKSQVRPVKIAEQGEKIKKIKMQKKQWL